jgi:hypothetical protein
MLSAVQACATSSTCGVPGGSWTIFGNRLFRVVAFVLAILRTLLAGARSKARPKKCRQTFRWL